MKDNFYDFKFVNLTLPKERRKYFLRVTPNRAYLYEYLGLYETLLDLSLREIQGSSNVEYRIKKDELIKFLIFSF